MNTSEQQTARDEALARKIQPLVEENCRLKDDIEDLKRERDQHFTALQFNREVLSKTAEILGIVDPFLEGFAVHVEAIVKANAKEVSDYKAELERRTQTEINITVIANRQHEELNNLRTQLAAAQRERDEWKVDATEWGEVAAIRQREVNGLRAQLAAAQRDVVTLTRARDNEKFLAQQAGQCSLDVQFLRNKADKENDQLRAEVARLTEKLRGKNIVITEKNAELNYITSQVAELQRDRERLEKLVPFFLRVDEDTCRASIHMGTLAVTFKEGDTLRSAIDAMRAKGEA